MLVAVGVFSMMALDKSTPRFYALERLSAALSKALTLRRDIDTEILDGGANSDTLDLMRELHWLCRSEMINLKSYCNLFSGTKTFMGFHQQFHILFITSKKMLANQGRLQCET